MAQVILRGKQWYSDVRIGGHRIRRPLSKDKREAQIELGRLIERLRGDHAGKPSKDIPWAEFKVRYIRYCDGAKKPATVLRDRAALSALEKFVPLTKLEQITPELLEQWRAKRLSEQTGKQTVNRDINSVKAMMVKAAAWGYCAMVNYSSVKPLKITRKKLYFHSPQDLGRLLAVCNGVWRTICLLGARAGLRREEMRMLTWDDVDFERNRLHITPKEGWEPKDYETRFIPIATDLLAHLKEASKRRKGPWVLSEAGEERPGLAVMSSYFQKLTRKLDLPGSLHILRHTFASHLAQASVPLKAIKDLLGHSDMATTEIYAELIPENLGDAVSRLPVVPVGSNLVPVQAPNEPKGVGRSRDVPRR